MRRKILQDYADTFCEMFTGWRQSNWESDVSHIVAAGEGELEFDLLTGSTLTNRFIEEWNGQEDELAAYDRAKAAYRHAVDTGELPAMPVWTNESVDLIRDRRPAGEVMRQLVAAAENALARPT